MRRAALAHNAGLANPSKVTGVTLPFVLDRLNGVLANAHGHRFDPVARAWQAHAAASLRATAREPVDAITAATWLQRHSGMPVRVPIGVIGPREASPDQLAIAEEVGRRLGTMGFAVI